MRDVRNANDEEDIEPIDVTVPVGFRHGLVCDVNFRGVIISISVGFGFFCYWRRL